MMKQDFSEPQKQSASGVIIMFVNTLQKVVRAIALPILFIIIKSKDSGHLALIIIAGAVLLTLLLAIFTYISFQRFSFFLDEEKQEFVISEGVFNRHTLTIQLNKIQQVNINQSLLQRIIGVYSLDIDTAGSENKEASIKAIDHVTAVELKQRLLSKVNLNDEAITVQANTVLNNVKDTNNATGTRLLLKLSVSTLFKVGVTTNYGASFVLLGGFILGLIQLFKDYTSAFEIERSDIDVILSRGFNFFSICLLVSFALIAVLATNIIRTLIKYFDFRILRQKGSLAISSGLFTRKNTLMTPNKVQLSAYSQNYFQKRFNLINIKIKQAAFDTADKEDDKKTDIEIPGCNQEERDEILKMIYQQIPENGTKIVPNYRFIFLQIMLWMVIPFILFMTVSFGFQNVLIKYSILFVPYSLIALIMLYFEFKRHRLYVSDGFIIKRSGIWDVEHQIIEPHKIQAITTKQYFWHKKVNIGHLTLHTAAGMIHFKYGNYSTINEMVNYWMYQVAHFKKDWN